MRHHVLRNALTPVITILGLSLGVLLTQAVLTETVFSWNGLGSYAVESTRRLDYPAINGVCITGGVDLPRRQPRRPTSCTPPSTRRSGTREGRP